MGNTVNNRRVEERERERERERDPTTIIMTIDVIISLSITRFHFQSGPSDQTLFDI